MDIQQEIKELRDRQAFADANPNHPTAAQWAASQAAYVDQLRNNR